MASDRRTPRRSPKLVSVIIVALIALASLPFLVGAYFMVFVFLVLTFLVLSESYDLVGGHMGYMNLGHTGFFGLSAYVFAIGVVRFSMNPLAAGLVAVAAATCFSIVISRPLFSLRGGYFAIASLAVVILLGQVTNNLGEWTGGPNGIAVPFRDTQATAHWSMLIVAIACVLANYSMSGTRLGIALRSIKEDEIVAEHCGINLYLTKATTLAISATWAGMAGVIYIYNMSYIAPLTVFGLENVLAPVVMALLGGSGLWAGPVLGTVVLMTAQEILWIQMPYFHLFIYGAIMFIVGLAMPGGILRTRITGSSRLRRLGRRMWK